MMSITFGDFGFQGDQIETLRRQITEGRMVHATLISGEPGTGKRTLAGLLAGERWIMDGDYSRTYEVRIRACDTAIFLDYPEDVCMAGITARVGQDRPDMPWTEGTLDPELVAQVQSYRRDNRPAIYALLEKYSEKQAIIFTDRAQADRWLSRI